MGDPCDELVPEREQTDESLRREREKTDRALSERRTPEDDADKVVLQAREQSDAAVIAARERADEKLAQERASVPPRAVIAEERRREDEALRRERAAADDSLRHERDENARALSTLLPLERERTDRFLLTERARSDDAVAHRDDFLSIVSHDLRNLIGGIVLSAEVLVERAPATDDGKPTVETAKRIQRYAARMNRLVGDLVDVASIDAGKLAVSVTAGDMATLIAEAVDLFVVPAAAKGLTLRAELAEPALRADFDHDRMIQVLANLITNAIKFTPEGGAIVVQGERAGELVRVSVLDTGPGIQENMLETIFERFWQAAKNDRRGLGLGLYVSRCIVDAHGGAIWAEPTGGKGTRLVFSLPVRTPIAAS